MSPARECGLSALRPTFGRVSRHGGMVLAWSHDRVGPICRTIEDCAMVFNAIHGVDEKDPSTMTTPFQFDREHQAGVAAHRRRRERAEGIRRQAARARRGAEAIGPRPQLTGWRRAWRRVAAAFDYYVQLKAKELGIDLATLPEPQRGAGRGGGGGGGGGGAGRGADTTGVGRAAAGVGGGGAAGGGRGDAGNPTGAAALNRWTGGRFPRAFDFIQSQRRRQILITQMAELLKDFDMYLPGTMGGYDVGLHAQTGHPCAVVPYKFDSPPAGRGGGGRGGAPDTTANRPPDPVYNQQPICAVIAGNLYNDDKILSVAHQYQTHTAWHLKHPSL